GAQGPRRSGGGAPRGRRGPRPRQHREDPPGEPPDAPPAGAGDPGATRLQGRERAHHPRPGFPPDPPDRPQPPGNRAVMIALEPLVRLLKARWRPPPGASSADPEAARRLAGLLGVDVDELPTLRLGPSLHYRPLVVAKHDGRDRRLVAPSP